MERLYKVAKIISSVLTGRNLGRQQKGELEDWIRESADNARLFDEITDEEHIREDRIKMESFNKEDGWKRVCGELGIEAGKEKGRMFRLGGWKYAAAVLVTSIGIGAWVMLSEKPESGSEMKLAGVTTGAVEMKEVKGVLLRLQDGATVDLGRGGESVVVDSGIVASDNGSLLSYEALGGKKAKELIYNEIYVPKGMGYQLKLSDGTVIHLNSMSKVRYPVAFDENTRVIELEGEAFLEVAKDSMRPFVVKTRSMSVRVLGTKFDVSCYEDDNIVRTTLVEGSVEVECNAGVKLLKPNEQLAYDKEENVAEVVKVDPQYYAAWKEGWFRFREIRLEELMKIMMRWYDMDVEYADRETRDYLFGCNFNRENSVESMIRVFEQNGKVKIRQEGKKLIFSKGR